MAKKIKVRFVDHKRDGPIFKWSDHGGTDHQETYHGKRTRNAIDERKAELTEQLNRTGSAVRWSNFEERYKRSHLRHLERRSRGKPTTMLKRMRTLFAEREMGDPFGSELTLELILSIEETMQDEGMATATIASNMASLWAALNWGADFELLPRLHRPRNRTNKKKRKAKKAKGRPLEPLEIESMFDAVWNNEIVDASKVRSDGTVAKRGLVRSHDEDACAVIRAMQAMRHLGLRLEDCHLFRWTPAIGCHFPVDLDGGMPMLSLCAEQKSGEQQVVPLTQPAIEWLQSLDRHKGWVCRLSGAKGEHATTCRLGRIIANAGRAADVMVKSTGGRGGKPKYASGHDLRRTFATHWLSRLTIKEVQILTRHADVQTLLNYYSDATEEALAVKLKTMASGGLLGDSGDSIPA